MPSARQSIEMNATAAAVMAVLTDFAAYPEFLPEIRAVEVLSAQDALWEVRFHAHVIRPFQYTLRLERHGETRLSWSMIDGLFTSNDGAWELELAHSERPSVTGHFHADGSFHPDGEE